MGVPFAPPLIEVFGWKRGGEDENRGVETETLEGREERARKINFIASRVTSFVSSTVI